MSALKILIVQDKPEEAKLLEDTLKSLSYEVTGIADSLETAPALFHANVPDVMLIDILIQEKMDGITLAEKINETASKKKPVIFLTHLMDKEAFKPVRKTNYLQKPFDIRELEFSIELAVEQSINSPGIFTNNPESSAFTKDGIYFKIRTYLSKVLLSDIEHIEAYGTVSHIYTADSLFIMQRPVNDLEKELPEFFIRIHSDHNINILKIKRMNAVYTEAELSNRKIVPVSMTFRNALHKRLKDMPQS